MAHTAIRADGLIVGGMLAGDTVDHIQLEVHQEVGVSRRIELAITEVEAEVHSDA